MPRHGPKLRSRRHLPRERAHLNLRRPHRARQGKCILPQALLQVRIIIIITTIIIIFKGHNSKPGR